MNWQEIEKDILNVYPSLQTAVIECGNSNLRFFYLPEGFKDLGHVVTFGYVNFGSPDDCGHLLQQLYAKSKDLKVDRIVGPINFTTFFDYRLKMNNFDLKSFPGEPKNSEREKEFFLHNGFSVIQKYYSHEFDTRLNFKFHYSILFMGIWAKFRTYSKYKILNLTVENYTQYLEEIYYITLTTFSKNYMFQTIPFSVFKIYFEKNLLPYIEFNTSLMVLNKKNKLIGYSLCLRDSHKPERLLFKTIGVIHSERNSGFVALQLMRKVYLQARKNYHLCLACLMIEGNKIDRVFKDMSLSTTEYAMLERKLNP